jgi:Domain of unknown function (DUF4333)
MPARPLRAAAAIVVLAFVGTACTKSLDTSSVVPELERVLVRQYGLTDPTVKCPGSVKVRAGATFTCTGRDTSGVTFTFTLTQKDDQGKLAWKVTSVTAADGTDISTGPTPTSST